MISRSLRGAGWLAAAALAATAGSAIGQQPKTTTPPAAKSTAPAPTTQAAAPPPPWVKVCEKIPFMAKDKDGKDVREEREICLTQHERIDGNSGIVLVSAGIREVEKFDKKYFMVMVPLGMSIPDNMKVGIYPKAQWEKLEKGEQPDDKDLKPINVPYQMCHFAGCSGEVELTAELDKELKAGAGMVVLVVNGAGVPIGLPVPLTGLGQVQAGKALDMETYKTEKGKLMKAIAERQQQQLEEFRKQQGELKGLTGAPPTTGSTPAPAAKATTPPKKQ